MAGGVHSLAHKFSIYTRASVCFIIHLNGFQHGTNKHTAALSRDIDRPLFARIFAQ